jgi:hypothetical protein
MEPNDSNQFLVIKDNPVFAWIMGGTTVLAAVYIFIQSNGVAVITALLLLGFAFLVLFLFGKTTIMKADRYQRMLFITHQSLLGKKEQTYSFGEVSKFEVEPSRYRISHNDGSTTYRMVMHLKNGETIPLETAYSNGYNRKAARIRQLSEFMGLANAQDIPQNQIQAAIASAVQISARPELDQKGSTAGVDWTMEVHNISGKLVTRWISTQFTWPGKFLLLSQKPKSKPQPAKGGFLGNLILMVFQQVIGMYGIKPSDTPNFEQAENLVPADETMAMNFSAFSNDPNAASALFNPTMAQPLNRWTQNHPLKNANSISDQLLVLYSPTSLMVCAFGQLNPQQSEELISIGVDLIKALSSSNY